MKWANASMHTTRVRTPVRARARRKLGGMVSVVLALPVYWWSLALFHKHLFLYVVSPSRLDDTYPTLEAT